jgi:hypothetical protein
MTITSTRRPRRTRADKQAWTVAEKKRLDALADALTDEARNQYAARFDMYSPRNAALIGAQMPEATIVHGYNDWQTKCGRQVRDGEHCHIRIYAYRGDRTRSTTTAVPADGAGAAEPQTRPLFGLVRVYDISQTDEL